MSYISLIVALVMTLAEESSIPSGAWLDVYLNHLVGVETFFLGVFKTMFIVFLGFAVVIGVISLFAKKGEGVVTGMGCGLIAIMFGILPLLEWVTLQLAKGMASSVDPTGIVNAGKFWVCTAIYMLIGAG